MRQTFSDRLSVINLATVTDMCDIDKDVLYLYLKKVDINPDRFDVVYA